MESPQIKHLMRKVGSSFRAISIKRNTVSNSTDEKRSLTVIWKIDNFSVHDLSTVSFIQSPCFGNVYQILRGHSWNASGEGLTMTLHPNGTKSDNNILLVTFEDTSKTSLPKFTAALSSRYPLYFKISLERADGTLVTFQSGVYDADSSGEGSVKVAKSVLARQGRDRSFLPLDTLTVLCQFSEHELTTQPLKNIQFIARTRMQGERRFFDWVINAKDTKGKDEQKYIHKIKGNTFDFNIVLERKIYTEIDLQGCIYKISFSNNSKIKSFVRFLCEIYIVSGSWERHLARHQYVVTPGGKEEHWTDPPELRITEQEFSSPEEFTLHFEVAATDGSTQVSQIEEYQECIEHRESLSHSDDFATTPEDTDVLKEDIRSLHQHMRLCDFTLEAEGVSLPVHKTVLAARSPVFLAMFESNMKEREYKMADITDVDAETLKRFIKYMYCDIVEDMDIEGTTSLFFAADKYQVQSLKSRCASILKSRLSVENVCQVLSLADTHQDRELMKVTVKFVLWNSRIILDSQEWKKLMSERPQLTGDIMHEMCAKRFQS